MSQNTGRKPHHDKTGQYTHECAYCGVTFQDNRASTKYCTFEHKQAANNKRFYENHRREMIYRAMLSKTRSAKKTAKTPRKAAKQGMDFESMSSEELMEYIQKNPHAVRAAK